jgi:methyl-accepting chemotaxis protein
MITLIIIGAAILILIPVLIFYSIMVTRPLKKVENVIDTLSHGNLSVRCDIEGKDEFGSLSKSINGLSERFEKIITSVARSVDGFYAATSEISEGNQDLSQRTSEQASSLQEITASIEEMLTKIDNTLTNSERAKELSNTIKDETEKLNESSKQMHEIIQVIESISFETNLLALNASIEAARAGEAGRGFEVVATEVKELSQRSSSQAKEIYTIIEDNINRIKHNVSLVDNIDDIIAEITESSKDQHNASHQISESISQLNNVTQENAGLVEEAAAASEEISSQAKSLKDEIAFFSSKKVEKLPTGLDEVIPSGKGKEDDKVKNYLEHIKNENMSKEDEHHGQKKDSDESNNDFKKY